MPAPLTRLAICMAGALLLASLSAPARGHPGELIELTRETLPAVVNISTSNNVESASPERQMPELPPGLEEFFGRDFFERFFGQPGPGRQPERSSLGSGFIIDPEGFVVTNNHVIQEADEITVILQDGVELSAEVVGRDPKTDLALIKVESERALPAVDWGDSDRLEIGQWVIAIGNPFGLGGTVTAGIVSQRSRDIRAGPYDDFIQTDAAINRGNSGGPLFNTDGEVVGVNTAIFSPSGGSIGIGFAIPSNIASSVIDQLRARGEVSRGWLGVSIQPITEELAEALALPARRGALIASVDRGSPAASGGLETGDVILSFDGNEIDDPRDLARTVADTVVGKEVEVLVWRDKRERSKRVVVGRLAEEDGAEVAAVPESPAEEPTGRADLHGLSLADLSAELRARYGISGEAEGVLVLDVAPGSAGAERGLRSGDLIVRVGEAGVSDLADIAAALAAADESGAGSVLVLVERNGTPIFVTLPVEDDRG